LAQLNDKQAVAPLLAKLDDQVANVRKAVIGALGQLADNQAAMPLLAKLDDQDTGVQITAIETLGKLGDEQAVARLRAKLDDQDANVATVVAIALAALDESEGIAALSYLLTSASSEVRQVAVRSYVVQREVEDRQLLSRDFDAMEPWIDPQELITEARVVNASRLLDITPEQVRSRYEAMAVDLNLKLVWRD